MKKKKLAELPVMERNQKEKRTYEILPHTEMVDNVEHLAVDVYYSVNKEPTYRIFLNDEDYCTIDYTKNKQGIWTHQELLEIIGEYGWLEGRKDLQERGRYLGKMCKKKTLITQKGLSIIRDFTKMNTVETIVYEPEEYITEYQKTLRKRKLEIRDKRVTDDWDRQIGILPHLPDDWDEFVEKEVWKNHYLFYDKTVEKIEGQCMYCKKIVRLDYARHKRLGKCPECGKEVITVDRRRTDYIWNNRSVWITQKDGDRTIIRTFNAYITYHINALNVEVKKNISPVAMTILNGKRKSVWRWDSYKQRTKNRWVSGLSEKYYGYETWQEGCMYRSNVREWQQDTRAGYLPLRDMPYEINIPQRNLYGTSQEYIDAAEKLMKIGLWYLGVEMLKGSMRPEKRIQDILKVENNELEILKSVNANYYQYEFMQEMKSAGKKVTAEDLERYQEMEMPLNMILKMIPYTTFYQIYKRYRFNSRKIIMDYYNDYFNMCKELKFDMRAQFVLFPKNIKKAHDDLVAYYNEKKDELIMKKRNGVYAKVAKMEKDLNKLYGVEDEECLIRAPHDAAEIIKEGHAMHHCVGGESYTKKITEGKAYILFIRKKENPEKSWYTMEVKSNYEVVQVRGFANGDQDKIREKNIWKLFNQRLKELKKAIKAAG